VKTFEFHEYTCSGIQDPDLAAYGREGWELVAVLPCEERPPLSYTTEASNKYTFFLQREREYP